VIWDGILITKWLMVERGEGFRKMARDEEIIIILVGNKRGEDKGIEKNA
jgi:hypothetical protein